MNYAIILKIKNMYQPIILCIALRYIYAKTINSFSQCIYWISSISIILSIIAMIVILSIMNGFERELKNNILYFIPHAIITTTTKYIHINNIPDCLFSDAILNNIKYIKPLVISDVLLQSTQKISLGIMFGINPNHFEPLSKYLIYHHIHKLESGKYYIIIGSGLAKQLSVNINDQIRLTIPTLSKITPFGCFPTQRVFTILDIYVTTSEVDNYQILVHQDDAAKIMCYPPKYVTGWRIWMHDPIKANQYSKKNFSKEWNWKDWSEYKSTLFQAVKIEKNIIYILFTLIVIVSSFNIISFLALLISDKQKDIAILKTYGLSRFRIIMIFMIHSISNGIPSIILGSILGILISKKINQILFFLNFASKTIIQFPVEIQYYQIFNINLMVFMLMIISTFYPAWHISKIQPAKILRQD